MNSQANSSQLAGQVMPRDGRREESVTAVMYFLATSTPSHPGGADWYRQKLDLCSGATYRLTHDGTITAQKFSSEGLEETVLLGRPRSTQENGEFQVYTRTADGGTQIRTLEQGAGLVAVQDANGSWSTRVMEPKEAEAAMRSRYNPRFRELGWDEITDPDTT